MQLKVGNSSSDIDDHLVNFTKLIISSTELLIPEKSLNSQPCANLPIKFKDYIRRSYVKRCFFRPFAVPENILNFWIKSSDYK